MLLTRYRRAVDTLVPFLGRGYRLLRDVTNRRQSIRTKYGFTLAGDPAMAKDGWEAGESEAFLELMETHDIVIDIGANVGFYSCLAASRGKHTIAFEPSSRNLKYLYRNLWENRSSNVEVFPIGLAGQCGLGLIYGYGGISSFVPGWAQARKAQSHLVPLSTLDTIVAGRFQNIKLLVKMDVEGFELDVLAGAAETLDLNPKPTWLVEILLSDGIIPGGISQRYVETFELFWKHGYRCRKLDAARTPVGPDDVSRWFANGSAGSETHDFLFSAI
jgi:FkbM family methyltransferase